MEVKVLFFARSRELAGASEAKVEVPADATTATFLEELYSKVRWGTFNATKDSIAIIG